MIGPLNISRGLPVILLYLWLKYFRIFNYFISRDMSLFGLAGSNICTVGNLGCARPKFFKSRCHAMRWASTSRAKIQLDVEL